MNTMRNNTTIGSILRRSSTAVSKSVASRGKVTAAASPPPAQQDSSEELEQDLQDLIARTKSDVDLLAKLRQIPTESIQKFQDSIGNTLLHLILNRKKRNKARKIKKRKSSLQTTRTSTPSSPNKKMSSASKAVIGRLLARSRQAEQEQEQEEQQHECREDKVSALLELVDYLVHCTDNVMDDDEIIGLNEFFSIESTVSRYNSLVRVNNQAGSLPLHTACRNPKMPEEIIQYIVDSYPRALQIPDMIGNLPLHGAVAKQTSVEVIYLLTQAFPEAVKTVNEDGNLPLHIAVRGSMRLYRQDSSEELLDAVIMDVMSSSSPDLDTTSAATTAEQEQQQAAAEASSATSATAMAPARNNNPNPETNRLEVIQYLVGHWPESIHETNHDGQTPLQVALDTRASKNICEFLQSCCCKDDDDDDDDELMIKSVTFHVDSADDPSTESTVEEDVKDLIKESGREINDDTLIIC